MILEHISRHTTVRGKTSWRACNRNRIPPPWLQLNVIPTTSLASSCYIGKGLRVGSQNISSLKFHATGLNGPTKAQPARCDMRRHWMMSKAYRGGMNDMYNTTPLPFFLFHPSYWRIEDYSPKMEPKIAYTPCHMESPCLKGAVLAGEASRVQLALHLLQTYCSITCCRHCIDLL